MSKILRIIGDFHLSDSTPRSWATDYFENCLDEFEKVCNGTDILICLGDFFDKPTISESSKAKLIRKLDYITSKGTQVYTIVGNHDIISYNMGESMYERTTLNLMAEIGRLKVLREEPLCFKTSFGNIIFTAYNGCKGSVLKKVAKKKEDINILLAHTFLDNDLDEILNLRSADITKAGYNFAFFGHDHEPHKDKANKFFRPGAFSRTSSHKYNLTRKPEYYEIDLDATELSISRKELSNVLESKDLFREDAFIKDSNTEKMVFLGNLDEMFSSYKNKSKKDVLSLSKVLTELETPDEVIGYLKDQHITNNVSWN